jgi:hypothetical protein
MDQKIKRSKFEDDNSDWSKFGNLVHIVKYKGDYPEPIESKTPTEVEMRSIASIYSFQRASARRNARLVSVRALEIRQLVKDSLPRKRKIEKNSKCVISMEELRLCGCTEYVPWSVIIHMQRAFHNVRDIFYLQDDDVKEICTGLHVYVI